MNLCLSFGQKNQVNNSLSYLYRPVALTCTVLPYRPTLGEENYPFIFERRGCLFCIKYQKEFDFGSF